MQRNRMSNFNKGRRVILVALASCIFKNPHFAWAFSNPQYQLTRLPVDRYGTLVVSSSFEWKNSRFGKVSTSTRSKRTRLHSSTSIPSIAWLYLSLLALQFGCQPMLTKAYTPSNIVRSTVILAQDSVRFFACCIVLLLNGTWHASLQNWTLRGALLGAGIPSALYLVQNYCVLMAYQNLPPVTFNVLNQTKTLSAALCCFLVMGRKQSQLQVVSLLLLLLSALVIEKVVPIFPPKGQSKEEEKPKPQKARGAVPANRFAMGVVPVLMASFISGLGESPVVTFPGKLAS
jgi:hypothetical protein